MAKHIKTFLSNLITPKDNWKVTLLYNWRSIIGNLHKKVTIEKIYNDSIVLGVQNSCWMQELYMLSPLLIKIINEKLDRPRIKQVRFKHTGRKNDKQKQKKQSTFESHKKHVSLSSAEKKALEHITDPNLRNALQAFRIRCYQE